MVRVSVLGAALGSLFTQNQIPSWIMSGTRARHPEAPAPEPITPIAAALFAILIAGAVGCIAAVTLFSARSAQPIVLAMLAFLAMVGTFFLFGLAAGQIQIGEKTEGLGLIKAATESLDQGFLVAARDGKPL